MQEVFSRDHVQVKITPQEREAFIPPRGLNIIWYPYKDPSKEFCDCTIMAVDSYEPLARRTKEDIENLLSTRLEVINDRPSSKKYVNDNVWEKYETILANPALDATSMDFLRSKAKAKHVAYIPEGEFVNLKTFYEKNKVLYDNKNIKDSDIVERKKDEDGNKYVGLEMGQVIGNEFDVASQESNTRSANLGIKPSLNQPEKQKNG